MHEKFLPESVLNPTSAPSLLVAVDAARIAGKILCDYFAGEVVHRPKAVGEVAYNLVTQADVDAEEAIAKRIRHDFPDHQLLGEEGLSGDITAEHLWVIDPLDGTNNFAHHLPHFAVCIAYYHHGIAQTGVVYNPIRNDWYWATHDGPALHNGKPMHVNAHTGLDQTLLACGFYYDRGAMMRATLATIEAFFTQKIHGIRRMGTAALDFCGVAAGQFGGYFEYHLKPWDFAAAKLILERAGGQATDGRGGPLGLKPSSVLVTNGLLHPVMLETLNKFHP
jgi:myo-inositol-1(or 4)-monophosphatase